MFMNRPPLAISVVIAMGLVISSCAMKDLKDDLDVVVEEYGYLKGLVTGPEDGATVVVAVFKNEQGASSMVNVKSVSRDESFYSLLSKADYTVLAFADSNGDFVYQAGEPAARIDEPALNWFSDMEGQERVDYDTLDIQQIDLSATTILDEHLNVNVSALLEHSEVAKNFLTTVSWDDDAFSAENMELGIWQPGAFQRDVGCGLYVLKEFNPTQKTILLVHGINDTPRIFEDFVGSLPDDYQVLLYHYPSAFPLEYTSYILNEALDEVIRRYELPEINVIAHSMGGLVSKGMMYQADDVLKQRMPVFITMASPFGGHTGAAAGLKWSPVIAPVWWAMAPGSSYLQLIDSVDLGAGPNHHLIYSFSHEAGGEPEEDDGVVTVESQLVESAKRNATAVYGVADNHVGVVTNACTLALIPVILQNATTPATANEC
jgi:pimeloyl-ACP methyl ester carboxylesterase